MNEDVKKWADIAYYDLKTAEAMAKSGRKLYVLFCCQQSLEKMLKALITQVTQEMPPRTHDLIRLAKLAALELPRRRELLYRRLTAYYIESRYPEEVAELAKGLNKKYVVSLLKRTENEVIWLKSILK